MKEMIYSANKKIEVLYEGEYCRYKFAILNLGTHPTAYVENKVNAEDYDDVMLRDISVHGGFTFCGKGYWSNISEKINWLGWDYAHFSDFVGYGACCSGKKWTTAEIYEEVKNVIEQLIKINEKSETDEGNKIKEIIKEKIKHNVTFTDEVATDDFGYITSLDIDNIAEEIAEELRGYRKQSDTVREFVCKLDKDWIEVTTKEYGTFYAVSEERIQELAKEYGVNTEDN